VEAWELGAREEIRELLASYAHGVDGGRFDDVAELFTPDGVLEVGAGRRVSGRGSIRAFLGGVGAPRGRGRPLAYIRHHVSNVVIELAGRDAARARSYFFVVTDRGPDHWGRYRDELVIEGARWRFARRVARTDGTARGSWAEARDQGN
jgi:3-phenylpropionate/cinnamic acid dioxygenase small subunit